MARGAGSSGYRGVVGQTRSERVHYTRSGGGIEPVEVYRCVNAATHPELAQRMRESGVNTVDGVRGAEPVNVSVVYHDPKLPAFVLVIPDVARHTELLERADLLSRIADDVEYAVPEYIRRFDVVFGAEQLVDHLDARANEGTREERAAEVEQELAKRRALLESDEAAFKAERAEFERVVAELEHRNRELQDRIAELDRRAAELAAEPQAAPLSVARDPDGTPLPRPVPHEEIQTNPFELLSDDEAEALRKQGVTAAPPGAPPDPSSDEEGVAVEPDQIVEEEDSQPGIRAGRSGDDSNATSVGGTTDVAIERWIVSRDPELKFADDNGVRLAATATPEELETMLAEQLEIKVQLHRLPEFPLVTIALGSASAAGEPFCFLFDVTSPADRGVLTALAREFAFELHLFDREYLPVQRRNITASLSENVRFAIAAADDHLQTIARSKRSYNRASLSWSAPEFDRHGRARPERALYRRGLFDDLSTPGKVWRALEMVANFSKPELEELLVLVWGEPLPRWNRQRGKVVLKAVEVGLWPGPDLAQIAVSAGAARSRKGLVQRLQTAFARVAADRTVDLDADAIHANWAALEQVAAGRGATSDEAVVSGTIGGTDPAASANGNGKRAAAGVDVAALSVIDLISQLGNKQQRRDAAVELCRRGDVSAIAPIYGALRTMTRAEAVAVLGNMVAFGEAATPKLLEGLRSGKSFIRHGSALALGVLKSEVGIEAICDHLLSEPTSIWRELARSVGEVGPAAVMSLVARLREQDDQGRERIAWALANVAARGGSGPIETLSHGRDPVAAGVARHALELAPLAKNDDHAVRGPSAPRDQTVNRAFSRKFFEAMNRESATDDDDALLLDEADLIEEDAEILDENDLIPT
jgi:hypothetical protein